MKRITLLVTLVGSMLAATAAQAQPSSGMLLGVYAFPNWQGLRVVSTIPGYSAHGKLFPGDVLLRVTADGINIYPTRTHWQIEYAKDQIGPFRPAALEVYRPSFGLVYLWVEFRPIGGALRYKTEGGPVRMEARIMTEQERPGARALFHRGNAGGADRPVLPPGNGQQLVVPDTGAASLFGR